MADERPRYVGRVVKLRPHPTLPKRYLPVIFDTTRPLRNPEFGFTGDPRRDFEEVEALPFERTRGAAARRVKARCAELNGSNEEVRSQ
jgi:hypothetical protein